MPTTFTKPSRIAQITAYHISDNQQRSAAVHFSSILRYNRRIYVGVDPSPRRCVKLILEGISEGTAGEGDQMQSTMGGQLKRAWLDEIVSNGVVMQRILPQHAGGGFRPRPAEPVTVTATATPSSASPEPAADRECSSSNAPSQQINASRDWLRGPLRDCAKDGSDDGALARSLLDAGAATEDTDRSGRSALHWAATRGNTSVVIALLEAGADGGARDVSGKTPLHCAAIAGHDTVVEALLDRFGCTRSRTFSAPPTVSRAAEQRGGGVASAEVEVPEVAAIDEEYLSILNARNSYGSTALHRAAFNGRERVVLALLRGGAGVAVAAKSGRSALHLACRNAHSGCVEILLAWGADESARAIDGSTPWSELEDAADGRAPDDPDVVRAYFLLNRTQSARAWGRRGWLLMLKARLDRWTAVAHDVIDADTGSGVAVQHGEGGITSRMQEAGLGRAVADDEDMASGGDFGNEEEEEEEDVAFPGLVHQLLELGEEGCFRLVVTFL